MSNLGSPKAAHCVRLSGRLTIATIQESRASLVGALGASASVELDCTEASEFDICFVQMLEAARVQAARDGVAFALHLPVPPPLAAIMAEGGFADWHTLPQRSAA